MKYTFHRDFYYSVTSSIEKNTVTFLLGPRKCGKTVCLKQIKDSFTDASYIDFKTFSSDEKKYMVFDDILAAIKNNKPEIYLLDEVTYVPNIETKICEIANELSDINNTQTKIIFTGSQSVALEAWSNRAFAGNAGKVYANFLSYAEFIKWKGLSEISPNTYNQFLYEAADFYHFSSLEEYLKGCLEETIISNNNTTNYIFNNDCNLLEGKIDTLVNICYQTLFTLHNQTNVQTFFKDNKLRDTIIGTFRDTCQQIGSNSVAEKIEKSFIGSYSQIQSQDLDTLKQAFLFLKKCDLITITPITRDLDNIPDIYRDLCSEDSKINYKTDLFRNYNLTINYPMFYVQILKDILGPDMPEKLPGVILGSIVECHARGLLPDGFEYRPIVIEDGREVDREIDYINFSKGQAIELTIASRHNTCFELLPDYLDYTLLTKNTNDFKNKVKKIDYCTFLYGLSCGRQLPQIIQDKKSNIMLKEIQEYCRNSGKIIYKLVEKKFVKPLSDNLLKEEIPYFILKKENNYMICVKDIDAEAFLQIQQKVFTQYQPPKIESTYDKINSKTKDVLLSIEEYVDD